MVELQIRTSKTGFARYVPIAGNTRSGSLATFAGNRWQPLATAGNLATWQPGNLATSNLATWQPAGNLLATCWQPAGNLLATSAGNLATRGSSCQIRYWEVEKPIYLKVVTLLPGCFSHLLQQGNSPRHLLEHWGRDEELVMTRFDLETAWTYLPSRIGGATPCPDRGSIPLRIGVAVGFPRLHRTDVGIPMRCPG